MIELTKLLAAATIGFAVLVPSASWADVNQMLTFSTSEVDADHPGGAIEGTLKVSIASDGSVLGNFITQDDIRILNVTGGLDGKEIHLNIGNQFPIVGTYENGTIVGYQLIGNERYRFTAARSASIKS